MSHPLMILSQANRGELRVVIELSKDWITDAAKTPSRLDDIDEVEVAPKSKKHSACELSP